MIYGLDVHMEFIQVCALGAKGSKRKEYRIAGSEEAIADWARPLGPRDQVVLEATFHSWAIHAIIARTAGRVVVANPREVKAIAHARIKTDKVDAYILARLLLATRVTTRAASVRQGRVSRSEIGDRRMAFERSGGQGSLRH